VILCHFNKIGFNVFGYAGSDFFGLCGHWVAFGCSKWGHGGKTGHAAAWDFSNCSTIGAKKAYPALVSLHPHSFDFAFDCS
jgi:hypothetical protein